MFTTADLPTALRLDPTAPHECGHPSCPDRAGSIATTETGVPSNA